MGVNNINGESATLEASQIKTATSQAVTSDKIKNLQSKENKNTDNNLQNQLLSVKETEQITIDLNEYMTGLQTNLRFSIYEKLDHQVVVEIKNRETDELIKQIPSEELLELRVKMEELTGLLFDKTI
ncbi:MAG: flagellar protein FlaG [Desulfobacula sp.]|jgi:flagellar protein FlaG|nr:flagellar protein FlaG [Desulfobacula sp.]